MECRSIGFSIFTTDANFEKQLFIHVLNNNYLGNRQQKDDNKKKWQQKAKPIG